MSRSFGGTASTAPEGTTDWILGPTLQEKWDDTRRRAMLDWMMKAGFQMFQKGEKGRGNHGKSRLEIPENKTHR
jgi:hypothetical protein